jgi:hypothetical protein
MREDQYIVFLGGGINQIDYVLAAKRHGFRTLIFEKRQSFEAIGLCDRVFFRDISDADSIIDDLVSHAISPVACISEQTDSGLETVGIVNSYFGLHGVHSKNAAIIRDKLNQRDHVHQNISTIRQPKYFSWETFSQLEQAVIRLNELGLNGVIKPRFGQGSHQVISGVNILNYQMFFERLQSLERKPNQNKFPTMYLLEEEIEGKHFALDGYVSNGQIKILALAEKFKSPRNPCIDKLLLISKFEERIQDELQKFAVEILRGFKVNNVFFHIELVKNNSGIHLIEWSPRGCGSGVSSRLFNAMSDTDIISFRLKLAQGENLENVVLNDGMSSIVFFPDDFHEYELASNLVKSESGIYYELYQNNVTDLANSSLDTYDANKRIGQLSLTMNCERINAIFTKLRKECNVI